MKIVKKKAAVKKESPAKSIPLKVIQQNDMEYQLADDYEYDELEGCYVKKRDVNDDTIERNEDDYRTA